MKWYFARFDRERRDSRKYQVKRNMVRDLWLATGLLMLALPHPAAICVAALFATFVSFMILDETA